MEGSDQDVLRRIPSVESVIEELEAAGEGPPRGLLAAAVRRSVDEVRRALLTTRCDVDECALREEIMGRTRRQIEGLFSTHYRKVVNATGIILHTGLGRAALAPAAMGRVVEELSGYSVLQLGVETGKRSAREERIEELLCQLTGAEAATVVNNNAAATLIVLATVGADREVIVSRGQLVEIGGSFRLPDVIKAGGARMVEVGTTNRTHARDYENAITENTSAIVRVHPSNYQIVGFSSEVALDELVHIAHAHNLVMIDDLGAGALVDFSRFGLPKEPTLGESIEAGADVVTASTDKLIGACQGGIILGAGKIVAAVRKNPLARALRVDKVTLAVLEATLTLFLNEDRAMAEVPTLRMLRCDVSELAKAAQRIADALREACAAHVEVIDGFSQMGSGSLPGRELPTRIVAVAPSGMGLDETALRLRRHRPAVFTRIRNDRILVDPRTLLPGDEDALIAAFRDVLPKGPA